MTENKIQEYAEREVGRERETERERDDKWQKRETQKSLVV